MDLQNKYQYLWDYLKENDCGVAVIKITEFISLFGAEVDTQFTQSDECERNGYEIADLSIPHGTITLRKV